MTWEEIEAFERIHKVALSQNAPVAVLLDRGNEKLWYLGFRYRKRNPEELFLDQMPDPNIRGPVEKRVRISTIVRITTLTISDINRLLNHAPQSRAILAPVS